MHKLPSIIIALTGILTFSGALHAEDQLDDVSKSLFAAQLEQAKGGSAQGQFYVGEMYEQGLGTPKDIDKAKEWFRKSANQGFSAAKTKLRHIERSKLRAREDRARAKQIEEDKARRKALKRKLEAEQKKQAAAKKKVKPKPKPAAKPVAKIAEKKPAEAKKKSADKDSGSFTADPCKGPKAKFMSTCQ
ncbi:MAG: SEL1-like repeat protein [Proteobacteria bacterium]|nr:SEL1-like repeat protein [Pseudomonadota bacterium]